jgi:hypothetical protein
MLSYIPSNNDHLPGCKPSIKDICVSSSKAGFLKKAYDITSAIHTPTEAYER